MILTRVAAMLIIVLAFMEFWGPSGAVLRDYRVMSKNISSTLDMLLNKSRYDKRIRPGFGGPPVKIIVNLLIKSMGPVSETDQNYVMDCYFRQTWYDKRLMYNLPGMEEFSMSWLFLDRVWKPDTFFLNGKKSYLHRITVPNKFLRLRSNGFIVYSMRLTIKASCPMHLRKFPLDSQSCPLMLGSYGYASNDVIYQWDPDKSVSIEDNVELSQYQLVNITTEEAFTLKRGADEYSVVKVTFHMQRNIGFFILQLYVPCGLIVCCSWVSFWIDPDAVPARVSLGVTTVLSMTTMGFGGRAQMPKVSYATALDSFVIICFSFVFAVMIEYACINFLDTVTGELKKLITDRAKKKASPPKDDPLVAPRSVSMIDISPTTGHIYAEIGGHADEETGHLKAPSLGPRRKSLVEFAAPLIDSLKKNIQRRKSEISIRLPAILTPGSQRRKSEASIRKPAVPLIKIQSDEDTATVVMDDEEGRPKAESASRDPESNDISDICCDDIIDDDEEFEDEEDQEDEVEEETSGIGRRMIKWIGKALVLTWRFFMRPWKAWKEAKIMPREEDVMKQMQSGETKEKFSRIDIEARLYFPIAFCFLISGYWILYLYYITDDFPEKVPKPHLNPTQKY